MHRWRKLECTDPETYEKIQKIQNLQKRLIAKTEEVSEKDVLIQEKEKLYIELKNILAKQSGPEIAERLSIYQANLKERTIIVMQPGAEKVMLMKYSPGWKAQDDITRQEMLTLTQNVPRPVIIHLNAHSTVHPLLCVPCGKHQPPESVEAKTS